MDELRIENKLRELFEQYRIIFWNDSEQEFVDVIGSLNIPSVEILYLDEIGQFKTKYLIELEKPDNKFLVYSKKQEPEYEDDWLLDMRLYNYQFRADSASIIVEELGLQEFHMVNHIRKRIAFFNNKEQFSKLKEIIKSDDTEREIDSKMIAVCAGSKTDDLNEVLYTLFYRIAQNGELESMPEGWKKIERLQLTDIFWQMVFESFGYKVDNPNLKDLLICLFITDFSASLHCEIPPSLKQFQLDNKINASIFLDKWRDSQARMPAYEYLSQELEKLLKIEDNISSLSVEELQDSQTFFVTEKIIANQLKDRLLQIMSEDWTVNQLDEIEDYAQKRCAMYWANPAFQSDNVDRDIYYSIYNAMINAVHLLKMRGIPSNETEFLSDSAETLFDLYRTKYYQVDQLYRLFHENISISTKEGRNILGGLGNKINDIYTNWFLYEINSQWENLISPEKWSINRIYNQYEFFRQFPEKHMGKKKSTVFVIISDALRFEVAEELACKINQKYRQAAEIETMLGVLPSYTALGMAALLPHEKMSYDSNGEVLVDGEKLNSLDRRNNYLSKFFGAAVRAESLINMRREDAREFVKDKQVVYIYHNRIDAIGDDAKTEESTFSATRETIDELEKIVSFVINSLLANNVFITADHGFIFTKTIQEDIDKYRVSDAIDKELILKMNKRFILGNYIPDIPGTIRGRCAHTAGMSLENDMQFILPKGMSRFHFMGGARFVHGGMSLQEIVIPVITVKQVRGKEKESTRRTKVEIQILGNQHRVTTEKYRMQLLQLTAVSERVDPLTVKIAIYDDDVLVSDIKTITFDSSSTELSERQKDAILTLQNRTYDHKKNYRLVARDLDANIEICAVNIKINRSFISDF